MTDIDSHDAGAPTTGASSGDGRGASRSGARSGGLTAKLMPELKQIAAGLGIKTGGMKKADLVASLRGDRIAAVVSGAGPSVLALVPATDLEATARRTPPGWVSLTPAVGVEGARVLPG